ncbi:anti-sigma factor domain-containing protein [Wukongibacter baidiensis]|uniref:anti-sigma factor domain-containing protein n=1 Tax=Wukongibacter baidiensis TaxID=1723361 RepID=UPI003D7F76E8
MMKRGMVLKLNKDYALIATDDSDFVKIKFRDGMRIGQKIFFFDEDIISLEKDKRYTNIPNYLKVFAALAACIAIAIIINNPFIRDQRQFYAIVSLDINPSFELGIDKSYNVIQIDAMNEDSKGILDLELIGEPLSVAVSEILSDVEESGYVLESDNALLVSTVNFKSDDDEPLQKAVSDGVRLAMSENKVYENTKVIFIEADKEDLDAAEKQELSVGKYRLLELSDKKVDKKTIEEGRVSDLIEEEEIKDDLETDKTIQIIDGKDLKELNQIEEDIKSLKETVKQVKGSLDSDDAKKVDALFNDIKIREKRFINEDSEFEEIREVLEALHQIIEEDDIEEDEEDDIEEDEEDDMEEDEEDDMEEDEEDDIEEDEEDDIEEDEEDDIEEDEEDDMEEDEEDDMEEDEEDDIEEDEEDDIEEDEEDDIEEDEEDDMEEDEEDDIEEDEEDDIEEDEEDDIEEDEEDDIEEDEEDDIEEDEEDDIEEDEEDDIEEDEEDDIEEDEEDDIEEDEEDDIEEDEEDEIEEDEEDEIEEDEEDEIEEDEEDDIEEDEEDDMEEDEEDDEEDGDDMEEE